MPRQQDVNGKRDGSAMNGIERLRACEQYRDGAEQQRDCPENLNGLPHTT